MPELPEITARAREMNKALRGKTISGTEILQPKSLNISPDEFSNRLHEKQITAVNHHGKWIICQLSKGWILINLGMGGEVLLVDRQSLPKKYRIVIDFSDETCLAVNFWWFGYMHYCGADPFINHPMLSKLGLNALDVSIDEFSKIIADKKNRQLKYVLLDQSALAGIGNAYIHDILFLSRLHPTRPCSSLSQEEIKNLYQSLQKELRMSLQKNGAFYELDLFGNKGGFEMADILIGYKDGKPCPECGAIIVKIKTGSTSSFICPRCQV